VSYIKKLKFSNFRNLSNINVDFKNNFVCFYGKNAQGKTNILESIFLLANLKSFRSSNTIDFLKRGSEFSKVEAVLEDNISKYSVCFNLDKNGKRTFFLDNKKLKSIKNIINRLMIVSYTPDTYNLIIGEDSKRRKFLDKIIFSLDSKYLEELINYNKVLKNRNVSLKEGKNFHIWDDLLIKYALIISSKRFKIVEIIKKDLKRLYKKFFENSSIDIVYKPSLGFTKIEALSKLKKQNKKDKIYGFSSLGIHRDKIEILVNKQEAKREISTGQAKLISFILKILKIEKIREFSGKNPIFIYDDVNVFLDESRLFKLLEIIKEKDIQIIASSVDNSLFKSLFSDSVQLITVSEGSLINE
jgi:DNA replication and repair protein RecF